MTYDDLLKEKERIRAGVVEISEKEWQEAHEDLRQFALRESYAVSAPHHCWQPVAPDRRRGDQGCTVALRRGCRGHAGRRRGSRAAVHDRNNENQS